MDEVYVEDQPTAITVIHRRQVIQVAVLGAIIGVLVWGVSYLLENYVLQLILCQNQASYCDGAPQYARIIAAIVGAVAGLVGLVRMQIFRPLFVVLAATVCLWDITSMVTVLPWYEAGIACLLLYMLAYTMFMWMLRIRLFSLAALVVILLVVIVRYALVA